MLTTNDSINRIRDVIGEAVEAGKLTHAEAGAINAALAHAGHDTASGWHAIPVHERITMLAERDAAMARHAINSDPSRFVRALAPAVPEVPPDVSHLNPQDRVGAVIRDRDGNVVLNPDHPANEAGLRK